jgi:hypothetical protein
VSRNDIWVNGATCGEGSRAELTRQSTLRIGPMYAYFCLPLVAVREGAEAPSADGEPSVGLASALAARAGGGGRAGHVGGSAASSGGAAGAGGAAGGAPRFRARPDVSYAVMADTVYGRLFRDSEVHRGYCAMNDLVAAVRAE